MTARVVGPTRRGGCKTERHQYVPLNGTRSEPSRFRTVSQHTGAGCREGLGDIVRTSHLRLHPIR